MSWELEIRGLGGGGLGSEELEAEERGAVSPESWKLASCAMESLELGC